MTEPDDCLTNNRPLVEMIWPASRLTAPPEWKTPGGYEIRPYQEGDEAGFLDLLFMVGWPAGLGETGPATDPVLNKDGFLFAVHPASGDWAATLMLLEHEAPKQDAPCRSRHGELSWLAVAPDHRRRGLGRALTAAGTALLLQRGFREISLITESNSLNALRLYFDLGYLPRIKDQSALAHWHRVCHDLAQPFTPEIWSDERI